MKLHIPIIPMSVLLVAVLCGFPSTTPAAGTYRVGVYDNPPQLFISQEGSPEGIFIDFLENVAERNEWEIEYVEAPFSDLLDLVEKGEIDLLPSVAMSYERLKRFSMTRLALIENWAVIYRTESTVINNVFDLEGQRILGLRDGIHLQALKQLCSQYGISCRIIPVESYHAAMQGLENGDGDVAVVNRTFSTRVGGRYDAVSTLLSFNPIPLHFALPKGRHNQLIHALDAALSAQLEDPESALQQSLNRWLRPEPGNAVPGWLVMLTVVLLIGLVLLFILNLLLRSIVRRRTSELEKERLKTVEAMRSQKLFFKTMSHEIRTPLNQITGMVDVLCDEHRHNPQLANDLGVIRQASGTMVTLLTSVLEFADLDRGEMKITLRPLQLSGLFEGIYRTAQTFPKSPKVDLETALDFQEDPSVLIDEKAVTRITLNLVHNALKYTASGKVVLSVALRWKDHEGDLCIEVTDTGKGMTEREIRHAREPFHGETESVSDGVGLGLPIVRQLLELMGTSLEVESEPGQGSRFRTVIRVRKAEE